MRNFSIENLSRLNLQLVVGDDIYSDRLFTLSGVTSFSRGEKFSTTAEITLKGDYATYLKILSTVKIKINIVTDVVTEYLTFYVRHPVTYDREAATFSVSTLPAKVDYCYTDTLGNDLPYSFGSPWVKAVKVSKDVVGVCLQDFHAISRAEMLSLLDAYNSFAQGVNNSRLIGDPSTNVAELFKNVQVFSSKIIDLANKAPQHANTLYNFFYLLFYVGDTEPRQVAYSYNLWNEEKHADILSVMDSFNLESVWGYFEQQGMMPYFTASGVPSNDSREEFYNFYSNTKKFAYQLYNEVMGWIDTVTAVPTSLAVDIGEYTGFVNLKINGVLVSGYYSNYLLQITSLGANYLGLPFDAAQHPYEISIGGVGPYYGPNLTGKYVKLRSLIQRHPTLMDGRSFYIEHTAKVLSQNGKVLLLDKLAFRSVAYAPTALYVPFGDERYDDELIQVVNTSFFGFVREGTVIAWADSYEALNIGSETFATEKTTLVTGKLIIGGMGGQHTYLDENGDLQYYFDPSGTLYSKVLTNAVDVFKANESEDVYATDWYGEYQVATDTIYKSDEDGNEWTEQQPVYRRKTDAVDCLSWHNDSKAPFTVTSGTPVYLNDVYRQIFIVDVRGGIQVTGVKSKIGEMYVEIPSSWYYIDQAFVYEGITMTALIFDVPLNLREGNFTEDILVAVVAPEQGAVSCFNSLCSKIGYTTSLIEDDYVGFDPNFTVYGFTDVLDTLSVLTRECNSGYIFSNDVIKILRLDKTRNTVATINNDNNVSVSIKTTDELDVRTSTTYSWFSLYQDTGRVNLKLTKPVGGLIRRADVQSSCFDDKEQVLRFARFDTHRSNRRWLLASVTGFPDSANLEPYDIVRIVSEGVDCLAEIVSLDFNHEDCTVNIELALNVCTTHSDASLWQLGNDIVVSLLPKMFGYTIINNIGFANG